MQPKRWFLLLLSHDWTIVISCLQEHTRISLLNSRGCRMRLPGLFDAVGNITSLLFSVPFIGFQYRIGLSKRSHLCVLAPFLKVVPSICQNYCINTLSSASLILWKLHASCANHEQKDFQRKALLLLWPHSLEQSPVWHSLRKFSFIQTGSWNTSCQQLLVPN